MSLIICGVHPRCTGTKTVDPMRSCEPLQFPSLSTKAKIYRPAVRMLILIESNIQKRIAFYIMRAQHEKKLNTKKDSLRSSGHARHISFSSGSCMPKESRIWCTGLLKQTVKSVEPLKDSYVSDTPARIFVMITTIYITGRRERNTVVYTYVQLSITPAVDLDLPVQLPPFAN